MNNHKYYVNYNLFQVFIIISSIIKITINQNSKCKYIQIDFYTKYSTKNKPYIDKNYENYLYSKIKFGSDEQIIEMRMQVDKYSTYLVKKELVDKQFKAYNNKTSNTFFQIASNTFYSNDFYSAIISKDQLTLGKIKINPFIFAYATEMTIFSEIPSGSIGFDLSQRFGSTHNLNFIDQLKKNEIISDYGLTINYTSQDKGNFIIGPDIDEIYNISLNKKIIRAGSFDEHSPRWGFEFSRIFVGDQNIMASIGLLTFNSEFIYPSDDYTDLIFKLFFSKLIEEKKCGIVKIINHDNYKSIRCNKNTDITNFPTLSFRLLDVNNEYFNFNFTYKDLFEFRDNFFYFKIMMSYRYDSSKYDNVEWKFGRIFFKKFLVTLNKDKKTITFYDKYSFGNESSGSFLFIKNNLLACILIIVLSIMTVILAFVIKKNIYQEKKIKNKDGRKNILINEMVYYPSEDRNI